MLHPNGFCAFPVSSCHCLLHFAGRSAQWTVAPGFSRIWLADFRFLGNFARQKASKLYFFSALVLEVWFWDSDASRFVFPIISCVLLLVRWAGVQ